MKEMIKALIADGWEWVAKDTGSEAAILFKGEMPYLCHDKVWNNSHKEREYSKALKNIFSFVTFENSPVELKTLLVDKEEAGKEQKILRGFIRDGFEYLIKSHGNSCIVVKDESNFFFYNDFRYLCKGFFEKVPLKDLVKKRKVKKHALWYGVDKDGKHYLSMKEMRRCRGDYWGSAWTGDMRDVMHIIPEKTWEDEPIELFYEVEE